MRFTRSRGQGSFKDAIKCDWPDTVHDSRTSSAIGAIIDHAPTAPIPAALVDRRVCCFVFLQSAGNGDVPGLM
jgi:hypothetical protein